MRFIRVAGLKEGDLETEWRIYHTLIAMQRSISTHPQIQAFQQPTPVFDVNYPKQEHQKFALYSNKYI
jgi:hypothetical protein